MNSGAGDPDCEESGVASQALVGAFRRWAASEGSLPTTGQAPLAPIGVGGAAREGGRTRE